MWWSGMAQQGVADLGQLLAGNMKSQISNRDYQHNQNLVLGNIDKDITTHNKFLEGVTPAMADSHNQFRDKTYLADVAAQTVGIKDMAKGLGMSPWELTGQSTGGAPVQGAPPTDPQKGQHTAHLAQLTPIVAAKMANRTALQQTAMQSGTALQQTKMQTDAQKSIAGQATDDGRLAKGQVTLAAAQTKATAAAQALSEATERRTNVGISSDVQKQILDLADMLYKLSPTDTFEFLGQKTTGPAAGKAIANMIQEMNKAGQNAATGKAQANIPGNNVGRLKQAVGDIAKSAYSEGAKFLKNFTGPKQ